MNEPTSDFRPCTPPCVQLTDMAGSMSKAMDELTKLLTAGFEKTDASLARQEQSIALVIGDQKSMHARMSSVEARLSKVEDTPSVSDLKTTAALDEEVKAREELAAKVDALLDIAKRAEGFWQKVTANKWTKLILAALGLAAYRYLESHGLHIPGLLP